MIENAVTDLPLPDSPTRPSVSPLRISNDTSFTATTRAADVVRRTLDFEEPHSNPKSEIRDPKSNQG